MELTKQEQEMLKQSQWVEEWLEHKAWLQVVRPLLTDKLNQAFPDPSQFKNDEEFTYAAKTSSVFKKVITEILQLFEQHKAQADFLRTKKKGEVDKFAIGS